MTAADIFTFLTEPEITADVSPVHPLSAAEVEEVGAWVEEVEELERWDGCE